MDVFESLGKFAGYIRERESIRLRKLAGEPWPWTKDPILQKYKFTNIKREYDRTTQELNAIYQKRIIAPATHMLYNCGVYRYFGTIEFARAVGWQHKWDFELLVGTAKDRARRKERVFTGAYMVTNAGRTGSKEVVVAQFLKGLWDAAPSIIDAMLENRTWKAGYEVLRELDGYGGTGFMAKEVLQDFIMVHPWIATDAATWTPMGLGARRGINRLYGRATEFNQSEEKYIEECLAVRLLLEKRHALGNLTAHDVQFSLCEFDKYERVRLGQGAPRSLYHPKEN